MRSLLLATLWMVMLVAPGVLAGPAQQLIRAAQKGDVDLVEGLLKKGADPDLKAKTRSQEQGMLIKLNEPLFVWIATDELPQGKNDLPVGVRRVMTRLFIQAGASLDYVFHLPNKTPKVPLCRLVMRTGIDELLYDLLHYGMPCDPGDLYDEATAKSGSENRWHPGYRQLLLQEHRALQVPLKATQDKGLFQEGWKDRLVSIGEAKEINKPLQRDFYAEMGSTCSLMNRHQRSSKGAPSTSTSGRSGAGLLRRVAIIY